MRGRVSLSPVDGESGRVVWGKGTQGLLFRSLLLFFLEKTSHRQVP